MNHKEIEELVERVTVAQLGLPEGNYSRLNTFRWMGADSLDLVELVMAFEEETGFEFPDAGVEGIQTPQQVIAYLQGFYDDAGTPNPDNQDVKHLAGKAAHTVFDEDVAGRDHPLDLRGARCGKCYWALLDGTWCQNPDCTWCGAALDKEPRNGGVVFLSNVEAMILIEEATK